MSAALRRPGGRWRLLVHEWLGRGHPSGILYGTSHGVSPEPREDYEHYRHHHLPDAEFDELVVESWLHVEQMDACVWKLDVGGVTLHVRVDRNGRPKRVVIHGPDEVADPVPGCDYELVWSRDTGIEEVPHGEP